MLSREYVRISLTDYTGNQFTGPSFERDRRTKLLAPSFIPDLSSCLNERHFSLFAECLYPV